MSTGPPVQFATYTTSQTASAAHYPNHYPNVPLSVQPTVSTTYYNPYTPAAAGAIGTTPGVVGYQPVLPPTAATHGLVHKPPHPAPARPSSPAEPAVTPPVAAKAMRRLVQNELIDVGFRSAETQAVKRLETEVIAFIQQLFEVAHEYANLANRSAAIPSDLIHACDDFGILPKGLYPIARKRRVESPLTSASTNPNIPQTQPPSQKKGHKKRKPLTAPTQLILPLPRPPSPDLLPSDDESTTAPSNAQPTPSVAAVPNIQQPIPTTLRFLPSHFPSLPPKHTYLQTPASPPNKKAALPSLEKKLKTAGLVQESLKNLLLATEDTTGQEDAELLGHIVNWETGVYPRKRWKVGGR